MAFNFEGCAVYVYDAEGKLLVVTTVTAHNKHSSIVDVTYVPELTDQGKYNLLILTSPTPYTYSCIAEVKRNEIRLKLFRGEKKEQRNSERYEVNGGVTIIAYLDEGKVFKLHAPLDAVIVNISKSGVRLKMKPGSLSVGDTVSICVQVGDAPKILTANVVNLRNNDESTEYGCKLV